jgi:glyoxylase-like metal-dependent hydrolase (beta-lactamase superfamily II)
MLYAPRHPSPLQAGLTRRDALRLLGLAGSAAVLAPLVGQSAPNPQPGVAASASGAQPGFYHFKIGRFDATALADGALVGPTTQLQLWRDHGPEEISSELKEGFLNPTEVRLPFSVLLVRMGAELVLIDTGCGSLFGPMGGRLVNQLAAAGVRPEQITGVLLTHAHPDHMGGLLSADGKTPVFKNARLFINRREFDFWTTGTPDLSGLGMPEKDKTDMIQGAKTYLSALKFDKIKHGEKLLDGLEIIETPGHTPGHLSVLISSGDEQLLHLVDCVHHHLLSFAHPDWKFAFDADPVSAVKTRTKILDRAAADRLRIFGAHLPFPSLGNVRIVGKGHYEHVPEPWIS